MNISERLTYRQLQLIMMYVYNQRQEKSLLRKERYNELSGKEIDKISILQDTFEMYKMGLLNGGGEIILEMGHINPSKIGIEPLGGWLASLMELSDLVENDYRELDDMMLLLR